MAALIDAKFYDYLNSLWVTGRIKKSTLRNYVQYVRWIEQYGQGTINAQTLQNQSYVSALISAIAEGFNKNPGPRRLHDWNDLRTKDAKSVLNHYLIFLRAEDVIKTQEQLDKRGEFDIRNKAEGKKKAMRNIALRFGQPKFRKVLLIAYESRCAISGTPIAGVLEAAHILPYNGISTNHVCNGLLLRSDIHALFDLGLLSINPKTLRIYCSKEIRKETVYGALHGKEFRVPSNMSQRPNEDALRKHFENRVC